MNNINRKWIDVMKLHDKHKEQVRRKLQASLPLMEDTTQPVFPTIKVKEKPKWLVPSLFAVVLILMVISRLVFPIARISGPSMEPTLQNGHFIVLHNEEVKRFDIVVLKERLTKDGDAKDIVKRVIGVGGDVITVIDGQLYINNKRYTEPYLSDKYIKNFKKVNWTIRVPQHKVFVMGDNRDISKDSRSVGSFDESAIKGVKILGGKN